MATEKPQFHKELKKGDFVLFYFAVNYPDGKKIEGGRSIIGEARLGFPYFPAPIYFKDIESTQNTK